MNDTGNKNRAVESECGPFHLSQLRGAQSIVFTKAPYLLSAASVAGSKEAQGLVDEMMEACDSEWRGLGVIPASGMKLRPEWQEFDARIKYQMPKIEGRPNPACRCGDVLQGKCKPSDCKVFGKGCTPQHPIGACMVSGEGACSAYYQYS